MQAPTLAGMGCFLIVHRHAPDECAVVFAAWHGFDSPLRHRAAVCSCRSGGHGLWWTVDADDSGAALALLPPYLCDRAEAIAVCDVPIP
ncbi:MAG: hypothetical protein L0H84_19795 [Pseudonocardia sp.]|nr:hypothetical protein [Pseudonocardia sp.]